LLAALLSSFGAAAASPRAIFAKYGLFGTWAIDCALPPSPHNPFATYRPLGAEGVQRETSIRSGWLYEVRVAVSMVEAAADELVIVWRSGAGGETNRVRLQPDRMRVIDSTLPNGVKDSANGRRVADNSENPWFKRCSVDVSRSGRSRGPVTPG
jgi:hypothetical protein